MGRTNQNGNQSKGRGAANNGSTRRSTGVARVVKSNTSKGSGGSVQNKGWLKKSR